MLLFSSSIANENDSMESATSKETRETTSFIGVYFICALCAAATVFSIQRYGVLWKEAQQSENDPDACLHRYYALS